MWYNNAETDKIVAGHMTELSSVTTVSDVVTPCTELGSVRCGDTVLTMLALFSCTVAHNICLILHVYKTVKSMATGSRVTDYKEKGRGNWG